MSFTAIFSVLIRSYHTKLEVVSFFDSSCFYFYLWARRCGLVCLCPLNQLKLTAQASGSCWLFRIADWFNLWPFGQQIWRPLAGACVSGWRTTPESHSAVIESLSLCLKTAWQELVVDIIGWHAEWRIGAGLCNRAEGAERSEFGLG